MENTESNSPNKIIFLIISIIALAAIVVFFVTGDSNETEETATENQEQTETTNENTENAPSTQNPTIDNSQEASPPPTPSNNNAVQSNTDSAEPAAYETYSGSRFQELISEGKDVAIFFHASWCPTCNSLDSDIQNNISNLPANTTILKTDYDDSSDLKRDYGVSYQHTLVFFDGQTTPTTTLQGATFNDVVSQFNEMV